MNPELLHWASLALLGVVTWFVRGMASDFKEVVRSVNEHATRIAVLEQGAARCEAELALMREKYEDLAGFLSTQGFKRRDGRD